MLNTEPLCQAYLQVLYDQVHRKIPPTASISETYGEILFESVSVLLSKIPLTDQDIFFDLGAGLGKIVLQVFLSTEVKAVCGIEILPELYQTSLIAVQKCQRDLPAFFNDNRQIKLLCGDFLKVNWQEATVLLIGSPCFSPAMLHQLCEKINNVATIHTIYSLRPLHFLRNLQYKGMIRIECSWDSALCYWYAKFS